MKFSRIYQPRNPIFWILVALNFASLALSHIAQTYDLNFMGTAIVMGLAIANVLLSALLAWRLVNS
jgi:hypothetical protein